MSQAIQIEADFFIQSILSGMILLLVYDILRILRRTITHGNLMVGIEDFFYWVASSIYLFHMLFRENDGIIRGFAIIGVLLGMLFYHLSISRWFVRFVSQFLNITIQWLTAPFRWVFKKVVGILRELGHKVKKIISFFGKRLKKQIKTVRLMLIRH